jgi:hypothetical protein
MDIQPIYIGLAAFFGGILSAVLGWFDSQELFSWRKFGKSAIFSLLSGIGFAVGYSYSSSIGILDIFTAILGGAGFDALSNRVVGNVSNLMNNNK